MEPETAHQHRKANRHQFRTGSVKGIDDAEKIRRVLEKRRCGWNFVLFPCVLVGLVGINASTNSITIQGLLNIPRKRKTHRPGRMSCRL